MITKWGQEMPKLKPNLVTDKYGNIYFRKQINEKRYIIPSYTKDTRTANKMRSTLEYQVLMEYYSPKDKKKFKKFSELVKLYLTDKDVLNKWSLKTLETTRYVINNYVKTRTLPEGSEAQRTYQIIINACLNWANQKGFTTDEEPMKVNKPIPRLRVFDDRELSLLLNEAQDDDFQRFIKFAYYTGCRRGEINQLKNHVLEPLRLKVNGKTGERFVRLNSQAQQILMEQEKLWDYKLDYITKKFKWNARNLDIRDARFHDLRRTFGLNLLKGGMPIFQVSKLLGHSSVKTTEKHYAPLLITDIEDFTI